MVMVVVVVVRVRFLFSLNETNTAPSCTRHAAIRLAIARTVYFSRPIRFPILRRVQYTRILLKRVLAVRTKFRFATIFRVHVTVRVEYTTRTMMISFTRYVLCIT